METSKEIPVDKDECSGCHRPRRIKTSSAAPNANMRSTAPKTVKQVSHWTSHKANCKREEESFTKSSKARV